MTPGTIFVIRNNGVLPAWPVLVLESAIGKDALAGGPANAKDPT